MHRGIGHSQAAGILVGGESRFTADQVREVVAERGAPAQYGLGFLVAADQPGVHAEGEWHPADRLDFPFRREFTDRIESVTLQRHQGGVRQE